MSDEPRLPVILTLSARSVEMLLDLVEIKLGHMTADDHANRREVRILRRCRDGLKALDGVARIAVSAKRGPGRPPAERPAAQ